MAACGGLLLAACGGAPAAPGGGTGNLQVTISGLPATLAADVNVTGPAGYSQGIDASTVLSDLNPGDYTVTAHAVTQGATTYDADVTGSPALVTANATAQASVRYGTSSPTTGDGGPFFPEFHGDLRQTTVTGAFQQSNLAVDAGGTTHLLYAATSADASTHPVRYGECAADCLQTASWSFVTVGDYGGAVGGGARMALDADGRPRALWFASADVDDDGTYFYAQCDESCTSETNWSVTPILTCSAADLVLCNALAHRGFALDPTGHPAFFMMGTTGTYYIYCDEADCTDPHAWQNSDDFTLTFLYPTLDLAFSATGPRALYSGLDGTNDVFGYATCSSDCGASANWQVAPVLTFDYGTTGPFSFALDPEGAPRLAYFDDPDADGTGTLSYAWCDLDCTDGSNWSSATTGLPPYSGASGVKLLVDVEGTPAVAYSVAPDAASVTGASVAICTAGCETSDPTWKRVPIETADDIQIAPLDPCETGTAAWQLGVEPTMALDPEGEVHVSYASYSIFDCPGGHTPLGYPITNVGTLYGPLRYAESH